MKHGATEIGINSNCSENKHILKGMAFLKSNEHTYLHTRMILDKMLIGDKVVFVD